MSTQIQNQKHVLVWDVPTRLFHWLLAASFLGAYLISESERWRAVHALLGYTAALSVTFRLLWGLVGTRYARFTGFALAPHAVLSYLRSATCRRWPACHGRVNHTLRNPGAPGAC